MKRVSVFQKVCCKWRSIYESAFGEKKHRIACEDNADRAAITIYNALTSTEPCMIARFGSTELYCLTNYLAYKKGFLKSFLPFMFARGEAWWIIPRRVEDLKNCSGFFPIDNFRYIENFCELMLDDIKYVDILGSWIYKEYLVQDYLSHVHKVFLPYLEPYYSSFPWTKALEGKTVLVVHPFANQIKEQYHNNRLYLFDNHDVLPVFNLKTIVAVQSLGGENNGFDTWFDALQFMKDQIDSEEYDICIIGCGAYGFHLAAHVKRMGKKAVHLGGATQLLFGIKGNRWEDPMYGVKEWGLSYGFYTNMFNEYWVKPGLEGRPRNADQVEGACYW